MAGEHHGQPPLAVFDEFDQALQAGQRVAVEVDSRSEVSFRSGLPLSRKNLAGCRIETKYAMFAVTRHNYTTFHAPETRNVPLNVFFAGWIECSPEGLRE